MLKISIDINWLRYGAILALIVFILTGSIIIRTKNASRPAPPPEVTYPYRIALTFDDGPHPDFTDRILKVLQEQQAKATFFMVGRLAAEYPVLVQHVALAGHEIENHSYTHRNLAHLTNDEIRKELAMTRKILKFSSGQECPFFRPPGGQFNDRVVRVSRDLKEGMILWSVFPKDHEEGDPEVIIKRIMEQASDGGVVLLHSGRKPTLDALPRIIQMLRARGYRFVTITELEADKKPVQTALKKETGNGENTGY